MGSNNYLLYFDKNEQKLILVYDTNYDNDLPSLSRFWDGVSDGLICSNYVEEHCELVAWDLNGVIGEDEERKLKLMGG